MTESAASSFSFHPEKKLAYHNSRSKCFPTILNPSLKAHIKKTKTQTETFRH